LGHMTLCGRLVSCYHPDMTKPVLPVEPSQRGSRPYQLARALDILQGWRDDVTFAALARRHGVTTQRIQQIHAQALRRGYDEILDDMTAMGM